MNQNLHFPTLEYLKFGNIFSSSYGNFNFKIFPNVDDCKIKVVIWKGQNCLDVSEALFENFFDLSDVGFNEMIDWVKSNYENFEH